MDGKAWYEQMLRTPKWKAKRKEIYRRDNYSCVDCGKDRATINCHHEHYVTGMRPWEYPSSALVTVCDLCHDKRHKSVIMKFASHEEAKMWALFAEAEQALVELELEERRERIARLERQGAVWDNEGRYYCVADRKGRDRYYDEDGNAM